MSKISQAAIWVSWFYGTEVTVKDLRNRSREKIFVQPRQLAMLWLHETGLMSLKQIAIALGGFDHSTVLYGIRAARKREQGRSKFTYFVSRAKLLQQCGDGAIVLRVDEHLIFYTGLENLRKWRQRYGLQPKAEAA